MEQKGWESIGYWIHYMILNIDHTHDLDIEFLDMLVHI